MAKCIIQIPGSIEEFTQYFKSAILDAKAFTAIKHQFRTRVNDVICHVQIFEGYTFMGGNWLSMNVTVLEHNGVLKVAIMTSGGSNGLFLKNWSLGVEAEEKMLKTAETIIREYKPIQLT